MVKQITKYIHKGKEYSSLKEIKKELHNNIGVNLLDAMQRKCPLQKHKDYETLLDLICSQEIRNILVESLTTRYTYYDEYQERDITINILDSN